MKRTFLSILIFTTCLVSSACSYLVNFVVVNESGKEIELIYTLSVRGYADSTEGVMGLPERLIPHSMTRNRWEGSHKQEDWQPSASAEYQFDGQTAQVKIKVPPHHAVRILQTSDLVFFEDGYKHFPVNKLEIKGASGQIRIDGLQLFVQFQERDYSNRFIRYRPLPNSSGNL